MNSIGNINLCFDTTSVHFAEALNGRWETNMQNRFERITDRILCKYEFPSQNTDIKAIHLDLGLFFEDNFEENWLMRYEEALDKFFFDAKFETLSIFELLCQFLLKGYLNAIYRIRYQDINILFLEVVKIYGSEFKKFLFKFGHYSGLQERLVLQFDQDALEKGVRLLKPQSADFICSYVKMLFQKYPKISEKPIEESTFKKMVWRLVYAYLLTDKTTYFNKKSFINHTLRNLAANLNRSYAYLVKILNMELEQYYIRLRLVPDELCKILVELQAELQMDLSQTTIYFAAKYFANMANVSRKQKMESWNLKTQNALKTILREEETCRTFLKFVREKEIVDWIYILLPSEAPFLCRYAQYLDKKKEKGILEGKTGGEFALLKWQIMLPLVFKKSPSAFNRKQFVWQVFQKISRHYNLEVVLLLNYFCENIELLHIDKELKNILQDLRNGNPSHIESKDKMELAKISNSSRKFVEIRSDEFIFHFLGLWYLRDASFIKKYALSLDCLSEQVFSKDRFGKTFRQVKWEFILAILMDMPKIIFNKIYFVDRVLSKLAAHYNLKTEKLVHFFYSRSENYPQAFGKEIRSIFKTLHARYFTDKRFIEKKTRENMPNEASFDFLRNENTESVYGISQEIVNNAGVVLLSPFLPQLFKNTELYMDGKFKDGEAQIRAVFLLQYAVFGKTEFPEYELNLNKILTGCKVSESLPSQVQLTENEKENVDDLLKYIIGYWEKIKNTSIDGLRESFLQRQAKLEENEEYYVLTVESKAYDLLLDSIPLNFSNVKHSWMEKAIFVKWR